MSSVSFDNVRAAKNTVSGSVRNSKEAEKLKEACQQFESVLLAEVWKKMDSISRKISGKEDMDRPYGQMEDLALEMSAEQLSKSGGVGLWKILYEDMLPQLEAQQKPKGSQS